MGCQCANQKEEKNDELTKNEDNNIEEIEKNNNLEQKEGIFRSSNQEGENHEEIKESNNENQRDEEYNEKINEVKNTKYADYPEKMLELINKIREDPASYADIIEDSIHNIIELDDEEGKPKIVYKKKVKVALTRGEPAFHEAAEELRNMDPLPPLEFLPALCIPLPETEDEIKDSTYLKNQVLELRKEGIGIDVFFKDLVKIPEVSALLMIVDDNGKNAGKKRMTLLNREFKYIGVNCKFVGKTFIAYLAFSK